MNREMQIIVNGLEERIPENCTISYLIAHFGENDVHLIVEHNGQFVYPQYYDTTTVTQGDRVEFINPSFGG